jgi:hypothetical protein
MIAIPATFGVSRMDAALRPEPGMQSIAEILPVVVARLLRAEPSAQWSEERSCRAPEAKSLSSR